MKTQRTLENKNISNYHDGLNEVAAQKLIQIAQELLVTYSHPAKKHRLSSEATRIQKEKFAEFHKNNKMVITYSYGEDNRPFGVTVAYMMPLPSSPATRNGQLVIGFSRCNTKLDHWNRYLGLNTAIERATHYENWVEGSDKLPTSMYFDYLFTYSRAIKYFRLSQEQPLALLLSCAVDVR